MTAGSGAQTGYVTLTLLPSDRACVRKKREGYNVREKDGERKDREREREKERERERERERDLPEMKDRIRVGTGESGPQTTSLLVLDGTEYQWPL